MVGGEVEMSYGLMDALRKERLRQKWDLIDRDLREMRKSRYAQEVSMVSADSRECVSKLLWWFGSKEAQVYFQHNQDAGQVIAFVHGLCTDQWHGSTAQFIKAWAKVMSELEQRGWKHVLIPPTEEE
jgi:hypothetical protein